MTADNEMTCRELVELVTDYLEGALPAADRMRFDEHLAQCPWCVEYVAQIERTITAVGASWRDVEPDAGMTELLELFRGWKRGAVA